MANPRYQEHYRNGPPPQRQYYDDRYDQKGYNDPRHDQMYNQQDQEYNESYGGHFNVNDYQYNDDNGYGQHGQWDDRNYQEAEQQSYYEQQPAQNHGRDRTQQQRPHQYDDRYHGNGQGRPPPQSMQGRPPTRTGDGGSYAQINHSQSPPQGGGGYHHNANGNRLPKVRDRILHSEPESPKTTSWDNPFPTFPSKKKQTESRRPGSSGQRNSDSSNVMQAQNSQRPSTAHGNQAPHTEPPPELPRPHTSQSQRNFAPLNSPTGVPAMPPRKDVPVPRPHTSHSSRNPETLSTPSYSSEMPIRNNVQGPRTQHSFHHETPPTNNASRPFPPRRVHTGPAPQQSFDDYTRSNDDYHFDGRNNGFLHGQPNEQKHPDERGYRSPAQQAYDQDQAHPSSQPQQRNVSGQAPYGGDPGHRRRSSDQSFGRMQAGGFQLHDQGSYRGVPLTKKVSHDLPNFDVLPESTTEKTEDHMARSQSQSNTYQKLTYQNDTMNQTAHQQRRSIDHGNDLASPLAQFSFDLNHGGRTPSMRNTPLSPTYYDRPYEQQDHQRFQQQQPADSRNRPMQQPQRSTSQTQEFSSSNMNGLPPARPAKGNPPFRPGLANPSNPPPNYQSDYQNSDQENPGYASGYGQNGDHRRPGMPPSQMSTHSDPSRQGFDQRIQPRSGLAPPQQMPPRPATSSGTHSGPAPEQVNRVSSDSFQRTGRQNADSLPAHPAPFRPGLMQQGPPAPRPGPPPQPQPQPQPQIQQPMHQRAPSGPKPPTDSDPPVTIAELNTLQKEYKSNSNNYALGLKFAKRLVEAAKVLASENGRADAKQTAKNRERYILDAHRIVKRLCSAGYSEAMFYLADCYGQGLLGLEADPKEAFSLYQSAAKLGHAQAAYRVAVCCELGSEEGGGTRRDPLKAVQWYKRAASLGDTPAMYKMGMIQLKGLLGQTKNPREAISWLKRAAERADAENPHALHELGLLYENAQPSDIVLRDEKYALQLFEQAADLGYKYSQFRLGSAYEYGALGLPIDPRMSIAWYSRAAKQGEHQSEFALSGWYLTGSGPAGPGEPPLLQQSDMEAYLWARKAASSGLAKAEYAMGYYTEVGIGVPSNIEEAKRWYYRAAAQSHLQARERLEDLKKGGQRMQKTRVSRSNVTKQNEGECLVM